MILSLRNFFFTDDEKANMRETVFNFVQIFLRLYLVVKLMMGSEFIMRLFVSRFMLLFDGLLLL